MYFTLRHYTVYDDKDFQPERMITWCLKHVEYMNGFIRLPHMSLVIYNLFILETCSLPFFK
jgi:hypothetical protein